MTTAQSCQLVWWALAAAVLLAVPSPLLGQPAELPEPVGDLSPGIVLVAEDESGRGREVARWPIESDCDITDANGTARVRSTESEEGEPILAGDDTLSVDVALELNCEGGETVSLELSLVTKVANRIIGPGTFRLLLDAPGLADAVVLSPLFPIFLVQIKEVSYLQSHPILSDDVRARAQVPFGQPFTEPQWQDNSDPLDGDADDRPPDRKFPVGYTRNVQPTLSAEFRVFPFALAAGTTAKVRGTATAALIGPLPLGIGPANANVQGNIIRMPATQTQNPLPNRIEYFPLVFIEWEMSFDGGQNWFDVGVSDNTLYVTLGDPLQGVEVFHTAIHIGCTNAVGETDADSTVPRVWGEFADRDVRRVSDDEQLGFWVEKVDFRGPNPNPPEAFTVAGLLQNADGRCGAWIRFFRSTLEIQGITGARDVVLYPKDRAKDYPVPGGVLRVPAVGLFLLVKEWDLRNPNAPKDLKGIPGQKNDDPQSNFTDHSIVRYGRHYYDPSYGKGPYRSTIEWEDDNLEAVGLEAQTPAGGIDRFLPTNRPGVADLDVEER